jgi:transcriptional regulator with XRE-family HTH domain
MSELKTWRKENGVSQLALAKMLGDVTQSRLSQIESGRGKASLALALKIFDRTGVRLGELADITPEQIKTLADANDAEVVQTVRAA